MYEVVVSFIVDRDKHDAFRAAGLRAHERSLKTEPGTERFDILADEWNPSRFYINEAYADEDAFRVHVDGAPAKEFLAEVQQYCSGPDFVLRATSLN
ncbi:putative quinol monooxygenase [Streptomyces sp. NBC_00388]|uniref:putative quinol monooxygenase n=1 Tax=Streptomyces sp. NBC_00388 TaxID=2975735 RepID=UPI002E1C8E5F